jgi:hypothetical protein
MKIAVDKIIKECIKMGDNVRIRFEPMVEPKMRDINVAVDYFVSNRKMMNIEEVK